MSLVLVNVLYVSECTLCFWLKKTNKGEELEKAGRKCIFSNDVVRELAKCIGIVCNYGFNPSLYEIQVNSLHLYMVCIGILTPSKTPSPSFLLSPPP